jgi:TorA maturation chaperone TorD
MSTVASTLDLAQSARTRARRAELLGSLLVAEPGPAEIAIAEAIPSLAAVADDARSLAADYTRLLLREVPAYESVFRSPDGQLGRVDPDLLDLYRRWDFEWEGRWRVAAPDQLGVQLHCFAHLCGIEESGWTEEQPDRAVEAVEAQRELLGGHLGDWGPVAVEALRRAGEQTAYRVVAEVLGELLAHESARLRPAPDHPGMPAVEEALRLDRSPRGGPGRLSRRLLAPSAAGGFLTEADIAPLAEELGTPWRPSDTRSRLRHVIAAAMDAGRADLIGAHLSPVVAGWARTWEEQRDAQPGAARIFEAWRLRADATLELLGRLDEPRSPAAVWLVPDADRLAAAVAALSTRGYAVTVDPAPAEVLADVDAVVRVEPGCTERWEPAPPAGWDEG